VPETTAVAVKVPELLVRVQTVEKAVAPARAALMAVIKVAAVEYVPEATV
jgi:hypothetical protein